VDKVGYALILIIATPVALGAVFLLWYIGEELFGNISRRPRAAIDIESPSLKKSRKEMEQRARRLQKERSAMESFRSDKTVDLERTQGVLGHGVE
jgi:hypothetical protein